MADNAPSEEETKGKFQAWMSEVLDAREAQAATAEKEKADAEEAERNSRKTREPVSMLRQFLGM